MSVQVVWLKRDLRLQDHRPLVEAAARGPVCVLYVYEPPLWAHEEYDAAHLAFIDQSLDALDQALRAVGGRITYRLGRALPTLQAVAHDLHVAGGIAALWSHQETGNRWTFARDRAVAAWCAERDIRWHEVGQDGVCRPHPSRDGWASRWTRAMADPPLQAPERVQDVATVVPGWDHQGRRGPRDLGLEPTTADLQPGGSDAGRALLRSFLRERGQDYPRQMSSPITAWDACSRLSPHLAWGTVSVRTAYHHTRLHHQRLAGRRDAGSEAWRATYEAFESRLRWRGHFMQKLEDEPALELENVWRAADGLRENDFDEDRFAAWAEGRTGFPLVDACMRQLHATRWLNFRMRAMLVSFATHLLWLHWRRPALHLGRLFLDFEPGIHFSQVQMQAGTTGINAVRIYDPLKQAHDQDPDGRYIRHWVPELAGVPDAFVHEPDTMPLDVQHAAGCVIGRDYPAPIVDRVLAARKARVAFGRLHGQHEARSEARDIHQRHGSRRPRGGRTWR